jgi:hypothetical protein
VTRSRRYLAGSCASWSLPPGLSKLYLEGFNEFPAVLSLVELACGVDVPERAQVYEVRPQADAMAVW